MCKGHTKTDQQKDPNVIVQELVKQFQTGDLTLSELWAAIEEEMTIHRCKKDCQELHECC